MAKLDGHDLDADPPGATTGSRALIECNASEDDEVKILANTHTVAKGGKQFSRFRFL